MLGFLLVPALSAIASATTGAFIGAQVDDVFDNNGKPEPDEAGFSVPYFPIVLVLSAVAVVYVVVRKK